MAHHRSQRNRSHIYGAKKHPSSPRNASAREIPEPFADGIGWNNSEEAGEVEKQGARRSSLEIYQSVLNWDDLAAREVYYSLAEPTLQDYLANCERYCAHIDWETRRSDSALQEFSHAHGPMNAGWMHRPTFPNDPESYKHIVPSGWDQDIAPTTGVGMKPYCSSCEKTGVALDLPPSICSGCGYGRASCDISYGTSTGHVSHEIERHGSCSGPYKYWTQEKERATQNFLTTLPEEFEEAN